MVIARNGLDFYTTALLREIGLENIKVYDAQVQFHDDGLKVQYIGPKGKQLEAGLKETYTKLFLKEGYRVTYVGNGDSDIEPARYAHQIFAKDELLAYCRKNDLKCKSFDDLDDVVSALKPL